MPEPVWTNRRTLHSQVMSAEFLRDLMIYLIQHHVPTVGEPCPMVSIEGKLVLDFTTRTVEEANF